MADLENKEMLIASGKGHENLHVSFTMSDLWNKKEARHSLGDYVDMIRRDNHSMLLEITAAVILYLLRRSHCEMSFKDVLLRTNFRFYYRYSRGKYYLTRMVLCNRKLVHMISNIVRYVITSAQ